MRNSLCLLLLLLGASGAGVSAAAPAAADAHASAARAVMNEIADAGFNHSEIAETAEYLDDQIGGRMTNSPAMRRAEHWTAERLRAWGLRNVHTEGFDFGRGWWIEAAHIRMIAPRPLDLKGIPVAWTPPTDGVLSAAIVVAPMASDKDFAQWQGKLSGKIVLASYPAPERDSTGPMFQRLSDADMAKRDHFAQPVEDPEQRRKRIERFRFRAHLDAFLAAEGARALVTMSRSDGRLVHGEGYSHQVGRTPKLPAVELAAEDYRKLARLAKVGEARLEMENRVHFEDADHNAYNVLAEIPGADAAAGYVMAGAHLDSWVAADGAADNGAGSVMVMEAARILAKVGIKPRRTIRFALWAGEEQGLLGSAAYVEQHLARRPPVTDPALKDLPPYFTQDTYPVRTLPGFNELAAYFNIDNGSGKIRGIYAEGNLNVVPIFREWLAPFASMGVGAVVAEPTGGTDHVFLSRLGLPAFQFIQDPLDYESRVHHTDLDTYDHLRIEDMKQAAVVLATVLVAAADADKPLPRKPLPTEPRVTDPFAYPEPEPGP
ncbi:MAG TPA: M20/M25/M40 family metallo-hydrolase [Steroidobacteraceae bacterium]|nr:M20/M25/M40 family metallo-hydrolase [Steroidobacteraceae bacterium]